MTKPLRVLMLEGDATGPELLQELERKKLPCEIYRDEAAGSLLASLDEYEPDVLMCDVARHRMQRLFRDTVRTLIGVLELKDSYTLGHSERVTAVAFRLAELMGLNEWSRRTLHVSGLLHDVGKVAVPDAVLKKSGALDRAEFRAVQQHVKAGCRIVRSLRDAGHIARVVRHHHERWDGGGYPDGLAGRDIPRLSRLLAVADAFDAMSSTRPYRSPLPREAIVEEFRRGKGRQFDPAIVDNLLRVYPDNRQFAAHLSLVYRKEDPVPGTGTQGQ